VEVPKVEAVVEVAVAAILTREYLKISSKQDRNDREQRQQTQ
jgi:hypothetical protein